MASTFKSVEVTRGDVPRAVTPGVYSVYGHYVLAGTALVINDVIQMINVPAGARVLEVKLNTERLDTGTSGGVCVGDGTLTNRLLTVNTTACRTGGLFSMNVGGTTGAFFQYTVNDTIDILCVTAPETGVTTATVSLVATLAIDN